MKLVPLTLRQLGDFLQNVREEDILEAELARGSAFIDNHVANLASSCAIVNDVGDVFAIGGVSDNTVWMLCTKRVVSNKTAFLRFTHKLLKDTMSHFDYLHNYAYIHNKLHIDWLTWLGAEWGETKGNFRYFKFRKETFNV